MKYTAVEAISTELLRKCVLRPGQILEHAMEKLLLQLPDADWIEMRAVKFSTEKVGNESNDSQSAPKGIE